MQTQISCSPGDVYCANWERQCEYGIALKICVLYKLHNHLVYRNDPFGAMYGLFLASPNKFLFISHILVSFN